MGAAIGGFTATDVLGTNRSLSDAGSKKIVVLAFVGVDCPLARLYAPRLAQLAKAYDSKGVAFLGVDSNRQDTTNQVAAFARRHELSFPILKDLRQRIADKVGATRTPEVVVLDRDRRIRYRGRIDDRYGFIPADRASSYYKPQADRNDLQAALDALLAGEPVESPETQPVGCLIGRDREPAAHPAVTYFKDVAPILNQRCVSCHRPGQIAPFSLLSYDEAAGWADMIAEVTEANRMPPWHADPKYGHFANDARLADGEKQTLAKWAAAGAPRGESIARPDTPSFCDDWSIPEPDQVLYMSEQPYEVPATGVLEYKNFTVKPGWKEDRWISAIEPRPGNPSVVHHFVVFVVPPEPTKIGVKEDDFYLTSYTPGQRHKALARGYGRLVRAGSKLVFNVHYTPNGSPQRDRSCLGIKFIDPRLVKREVVVSCAFNKQFRIPPGAASYEVSSQYVFRRDSLLMSLMPHMHLRGKDFLYEAAYPDGRREILLSVPRYDFDWQTNYLVWPPKFIPKGTVFHCLAHYDNSERNLNNPNPKASVAWGDQTFDEMMLGIFETAPAEEGLVYRPPWWPTIKLSLSMQQWLEVILTMINLALLSRFAFRGIRAVVRSARGTTSLGRM